MVWRRRAERQCGVRAERTNIALVLVRANSRGNVTKTKVSGCQSFVPHVIYILSSDKSGLFLDVATILAHGKVE